MDDRQLAWLRRAPQNQLKGQFLGRFAPTYAAIHAEPLRIGTPSIASAERHVGFIGPAARERRRGQERKFIAGTYHAVARQFGVSKATVERVAKSAL